MIIVSLTLSFDFSASAIDILNNSFAFEYSNGVATLEIKVNFLKIECGEVITSFFVSCRGEMFSETLPQRVLI